MNACPGIICCPPSPFSKVGTTPETIPSTCLGAVCCPDTAFTLIPDSGTPFQPVTCNTLNEFSVWFEGAPVLCESGDEEFAVWFEGAPFVEKSDTY